MKLEFMPMSSIHHPHELSTSPKIYIKGQDAHAEKEKGRNDIILKLNLIIPGAVLSLKEPNRSHKPDYSRYCIFESLHTAFHRVPMDFDYR